MLSLLLDEQISPVVAEQLVSKRPDIAIQSLSRWQGGALMGASDEELLRSASGGGLTLVTYDLKTISPLLMEWAANGMSHGGVIFVDNKTIGSHDFGGLVAAITDVWDELGEDDWTDRVVYLTPRF